MILHQYLIYIKITAIRTSDAAAAKSLQLCPTSFWHRLEGQWGSEDHHAFLSHLCLVSMTRL